MSIYYDILLSLQTQVVTAVAGACQVQVRKRPVLLSGDALPIVIISPTDDGETIDQEAFNGKVAYIYPIIICLYMAGDRVQSLSLEGYMGLRQTLRNAIYKPLLSGAGTVYDTRMDTGGPFIQSQQTSTYELTTFRMSYLSDETRSA